MDRGVIPSFEGMERVVELRFIAGDSRLRGNGT